MATRKAANPLTGIDPAVLQALLDAVQSGVGATGDTATAREALGFRSLGFAVVGDGPEPSADTVLTVPTAGGKMKRVRPIVPVDLDTFDIKRAYPKAQWAFTYEVLKRGQ